jgi:hypothetical protein
VRIYKASNGWRQLNWNLEDNLDSYIQEQLRSDLRDTLYWHLFNPLYTSILIRVRDPIRRSLHEVYKGRRKS